MKTKLLLTIIILSLSFNVFNQISFLLDFKFDSEEEVWKTYIDKLLTNNTFQDYKTKDFDNKEYKIFTRNLEIDNIKYPVEYTFNDVYYFGKLSEIKIDLSDAVRNNLSFEKLNDNFLVTLGKPDSVRLKILEYQDNSFFKTTPWSQDKDSTIDESKIVGFETMYIKTECIYILKKF